MTVENISIDVKTNAERAATKINALSLALERLESAARVTQGAASSVSGSMNGVATSGTSAGNGARSAARGIDDVAKSAKKAQSPLGNFFASLKRIAMYRVLRTILKEITQAIKEGMDNLYEFSKAHDDFGGIASSFDGLASAAQTMKNQLGATFGQILAAASPILIQLMQLVSQLTQLFYPLAQAIAALEPVISAVISVVSDLIGVLISLFDLLGLNVGKIVADDAAASWNNAKKAAGDYKNTILGFDEINRLNAPGGGGSGGDGGSFSRYEVTDGDKSPFKFDWIATFNEKIDGARGALADLVAELALVPEEVLIDILVNDGATQPLDGLVQTVQLFPLYATVVMALKGNPIPLINSVRLAISNFVRDSVADFGTLQNAYATACAAVQEECSVLARNFSETFASITQTVNSMVTNYAAYVHNIAVSNATLGKDTSDTYNRLKNPLNDWISHVKEKFEEYQKACGQLVAESAVLAQSVATSYTVIRTSVRTAIENAFTNISTFVDRTKTAFSEWATSVAESAATAFSGIATSVYSGLRNAADNVVAFANGAAGAIYSWAVGMLGTLSSWASSFTRTLTIAFSKAWEKVKGFAKAVGAALGGSYTSTYDEATGITFVQGSPTIPSIGLFPFVGGSIAPIPVFADGGIHDLSMGSLFVAGEAGAEIVSDMGNGRTGVTNVEQMKEAVREGNYELLSVVQGGINIIVRAINEIDPDITLDGQSLAQQMYPYTTAYANRRGNGLVTIGGTV